MQKLLADVHTLEAGIRFYTEPHEVEIKIHGKKVPLSNKATYQVAFFNSRFGRGNYNRMLRALSNYWRKWLRARKKGQSTLLPEKEMPFDFGIDFTVKVKRVGNRRDGSEWQAVKYHVYGTLRIQSNKLEFPSPFEIIQRSEVVEVKGDPPQLRLYSIEPYPHEENDVKFRNAMTISEFKKKYGKKDNKDVFLYDKRKLTHEMIGLEPDQEYTDDDWHEAMFDTIGYSPETVYYRKGGVIDAIQKAIHNVVNRSKEDALLYMGM